MAVAYPPHGKVVPLGPNRPQLLLSRCTDLGCKMVAEACFGGLPDGSRSTISLQMGGSAYGIRTRVTAVRGRPGSLPRWDQRGASGHKKSQQLLPFAAKTRVPFPKEFQRRQSRTEDWGCRMIADGARRAVQVRPTRYRPSMAS